MTNTPAPFIWYDLMTPDLKAAAKFYTGVVGWSIADSGMPGMSYSILKAGDAVIGGMMAMVDGGPPSMWSGYIYSADVDADARRAKTFGGSICREPEDIPGVGRFAVLADPGGALFNIFKPVSSEPRTPAPAKTIGHVAWHDLSAGDGAAAWEFYSKMFHWSKEEAMPAGPDNVYQMFATGAEMVGGMMTKAPETPSANWTYVFTTDAIDAAVERVKTAGGSIVLDPMEVPGGDWLVIAADPFGATFGLVAATR